jgi:hypothetical protein
MRVLCTLALLLSLTAPAAAMGNFELIPSIGMGKPTGNGFERFELALGLGLAAGARVSPNLSVGAQFGYQTMSAENQPSEVDISMLRLQVVPAFHYVQDALDFSVGPTLGFFFMDASAPGASVSVTGLDLGLTASLMFAVSPQVSLGPIISYSRLFATEACAEMGGSEACDDDPENDDEGMFTVMFGVRF